MLLCSPSATNLLLTSRFIWLPSGSSRVSFAMIFPECYLTLYDWWGWLTAQQGRRRATPESPSAPLALPPSLWSKLLAYFWKACADNHKRDGTVQHWHILYCSTMLHPQVFIYLFIHLILGKCIVLLRWASSEESIYTLFFWLNHSLCERIDRTKGFIYSSPAGHWDRTIQLLFDCYIDSLAKQKVLHTICVVARVLIW